MQHLGDIVLALLDRAGLSAARAREARRVLIVYTIGFAAFATRPLFEPGGSPALSAEQMFANFNSRLRWLQLESPIGLAGDRSVTALGRGGLHEHCALVGKRSENGIDVRRDRVRDGDFASGRIGEHITMLEHFVVELCRLPLPVQRGRNSGNRRLEDLREPATRKRGFRHG